MQRVMLSTLWQPLLTCQLQTDDSVKVPALLSSVLGPPRQTYTRKVELQKFGYAQNYRRCDAVKNNVRSNALHTAERRQRREEAMRSDDGSKSRIDDTHKRHGHYIESR